MLQLKNVQLKHFGWDVSVTRGDCRSLNVPDHGLTNYIGTKAKCRHLKKLTTKGTLQRVFIRFYQSCFSFRLSFEEDKILVHCLNYLHEHKMMKLIAAFSSLFSKSKNFCF